MKNKFKALEEFISDFTGGQFDFERLVTASFLTIQNEIIPAWDNYPPAKKAQFEKQAHRFLLLYGYLGNAENYKFVNNKKELCNYDTEYLFRAFNIQVCPYCNENYTYHFNQGKRNYEIEHFFSKIKYPVTAICLNNLVPSCKVCNFFKSDDQANLLSPLEGFRINELVIFWIKIQSSAYLYDATKFSVEAQCNEKNIYCEKIKENLKLFEIEKRYNERKDIIADILRKKQLYNADYLAQLLDDYEGVLFKNIEDVRNMVFGASLLEDEYHQRPFSKLIADILSNDLLFVS